MAHIQCTSAEDYVKNLPVDVRKQYEEKISVIQADPYQLPLGAFSDYFRKWPDLSYIDMVDFLVFQHSYNTREQLRNVKSQNSYEMQQDWLGSRTFT